MGVKKTRDVIVDVRCLQDGDYIGRGVGRHALSLLRSAPARDKGIRLVGLVDATMSPLIAEARDLLEAVYPNAYRALELETDGALATFVSLSPMTHDPLFVGKLVADSRRLRAAVVYDFIPLRWRERYLPSARHRLGYAASIRWLAKYDLFAPISRSAGDDLRDILHVPEKAMAVTGAPLDPAFERSHDVARRLPPRHLLVVGGGDPRKNPEVVIRAHARCGRLQADGVPLVIAGGYTGADAAHFRAHSVEHGGRQDLIEVPGHVPEHQLLEIYDRAIAIVCASFDEGFSLPVIEGMASGVPCIASNIPAHRELISDASLMFEPSDAVELSHLLGRVASEPTWRSAIVAQQASVWPRFRSEVVGRKFWEALSPRIAAHAGVSAPAIGRGARPRIALLSPLPPDRSGVADYTAATCVQLGELVDLHVFTETERPAMIPGVAKISPLTTLPCLMPDFDRIITVVGNSHFHKRIFELLLRYGGACIAHDARMLGFYRVLLGIERSLRVASDELARPVDEAELNSWLADEGRTEALFLGDIVNAASPLIVHSPVTVDLVRQRHGRAPVHLPFSIYRSWTSGELSQEARATARKRLGIAHNEIAIATFGFVHSSKAPDECIWATQLLRTWGFPASMHFVGDLGSPQEMGRLRALAEKLGLQDHVRFADGYVSEQTYRDALVGADLGIQLRTYDLGGLSGALLDCAAAGLPTVTNRSLARSVGVPEGFVKELTDEISPVLLAEALANLLENERLPGAAARRELERSAFSQKRSFAAYGVSLCNALNLDVSALVHRRSLKPQAA